MVLSDLSNFGWWVTMLGIMGDQPWEAGRQYLGGDLGDQPKADRWPTLSLGWWLTIQGMVANHPWQLSPVLNFMIKSMCQIPSLKYTSFL